MPGRSRNGSTLPEYIKFLLQPTSYPHPVEKVELLQTHISFLTLAGDYVYKWKKPVDFRFVDFSTLAKRQYYCERELSLNRRLCPEIYLQTLSLSRKGSTFCLMEEGEIVEYGLKMLRMPEEGMLNRVIAAGGLRRQHLETIIDLLVPFYRKTSLGRDPEASGSVEMVSRTIADNFAQTRAFVGGPALNSERFARIKSGTDSFLKKNELFVERQLGGHIADCHGDLYSNNICLASDGRMHIFDCLEFNDTLRKIDICADVAFLAMDLEFHGLDSLSDFFIEHFIERSGDKGLRKMLDFYKCYRAYVRGKVGLLAASDLAMEESAAAEWLRKAGRYFELAEAYAGRLLRTGA